MKYSTAQTPKFNGIGCCNSVKALLGEMALIEIQIVPKNLLTPIAPVHQVINRPFVLNSRLARHRQHLTSTINLCQ
jgi:hypothetical protein